MDTPIQSSGKIHRPRVLGGLTIGVKTGCGNMYVQLNWYNGRLFEVFATLGRSGGCAMASNEALTRSVTTGLRWGSGVPISEYIDQLLNIKCPNQVLIPKDRTVLSCADGLARVLREFGTMSIQRVVEIILDPEKYLSSKKAGTNVDGIDLDLQTHVEAVKALGHSRPE